MSVSKFQFERQPLPILFHIRHFGVGGIEAALQGWLAGLDRKQFAPALSVFLPTREWFEIHKPRLPDDVAVYEALPADSCLVRLHQQRRDFGLGVGGRLALGVQLETIGRRALKRHVLQLQQRYPVIVDFDHSLRRYIPSLNVPVLGVRHFAFWDEANAKARRVGRQLRQYDRVLVLNEDMRRQAVALYGKPEQGGLRCEVMPNLFNLAAMAEAARQPLPAPMANSVPENYAVCVARLDIHTKGLDTLVQAWRIVREHLPQAHLVIVGDGPDRPALEQQVAAAGLNQAVTLVGMQTNPYSWIARARLLVSASRSEGAPNVLIEALALGTPVVATACPVGPADTLQGGASGALVPVEDGRGLAQAMVHAWTDELWREQVIQAGLQRAQYFSAEAGSLRLRKVLDEVLSERA